MKKALYILLILFAAVAALYFLAIPNVSKLKKENPKKTSLMLYREAEWKARGLNRKASSIWVPYSRISPYLVKATIIAEDDKFWSHEGFDYDAMRKAMEKDIKAGKFKAGGSTISQQLAKNLYLTPEKSALRKIREAAITWKIERTLSKRRILELYLNVVEWGDGIFGAEAASRQHFGKSAADLTPMEAARLAVVLPNPRRLKASGDQRYVAARAEVVYEIMVRRGIVVPEFEEAQGEAPVETPANGVETAPAVAPASGIEGSAVMPAPLEPSGPFVPENRPAH